MGRFLDILAGKTVGSPPVWLMRQAGRYLPEYRAVRATAPDFLAFCYDPEKAVEVTLQPIRRFGFDAAIVFSDILVIPDALGQQVRFEQGEGPRLEAVTSREDLSRLAGSLDEEKLAPVYATLSELRRCLPSETGLIGFAGAPWTLATYMIAGRGTPDQAPARRFAYRDPEAFAGLIGLLVRAVTAHLRAQIQAGAQAVQIFDSWAGVLPGAEFDRWVTAPIAEIVRGVKATYPDVPVIAFPRGMHGDVRRFQKAVGADAIGVDTAGDLEGARAALGSAAATQGNLDPLVLIEGGDALDRALDRLLDVASGGRHVVNLGHGILPETPIAHVERLVERVRGCSISS